MNDDKGLTGSEEENKDQQIIQDPIAKTAEKIAIFLIGVFAAILCFIGIVAATKEPAIADGWLDLLKSGFLTLAGALTSVIGYYFGSRGTQQAQEIATKSELELNKQMKELEEFKNRFSPSSNEVDLILPDEEIEIEEFPGISLEGEE